MILRVRILCFILGVVCFGNIYCQDTIYKDVFDIPYFDQIEQDPSTYKKKKALLDIHYPEGDATYPVIVWFHGGGLTSGENDIPEALKRSNCVIVSVDYRLSPRVKPEVCIDDASEALAWVFNNVKDYNGDEQKIFVAGHSAGAYLAMMSVLDTSRLETFGIDANQVAGLIPFSGHAITHFEIRKQRGIAATQAVVDVLAPLFHVRADAPPILLITGDRELELLGRYEENAYFYRMMKIAGHEDIALHELEGYGHQMTEPAFPLLLEFISKHSK